MFRELKEILERKVDEPLCLDRLTDYSQEILLSPFAQKVCGDCECPDDSCDGCGAYGAMLQMEYEIQTQVIVFAEGLVAAAKEGLER